jgi:hypothetical protein
MPFNGAHLHRQGLPLGERLLQEVVRLHPGELRVELVEVEEVVHRHREFDPMPPVERGHDQRPVQDARNGQRVAEGLPLVVQPVLLDCVEVGQVFCARFGPRRRGVGQPEAGLSEAVQLGPGAHPVVVEGNGVHTRDLRRNMFDRVLNLERLTGSGDEEWSTWASVTRGVHHWQLWKSTRLLLADGGEGKPERSTGRWLVGHGFCRQQPQVCKSERVSG